MNLTTAKAIAKRKEENAATIARLKEEAERIEEESTARKRERNRQAQLDAMREQHEILKAENALVAQSTEDPAVATLKAEDGRLAREDMALQREVGIVSREFIRIDAVAHFKQERDAALAKIEEIKAAYRDSKTISAGPRTRAQIGELEDIVAGHDRNAKLYSAGSRIAAIRARRAEIRAELETLEDKRRQSALAVA